MDFDVPALRAALADVGRLLTLRGERLEIFVIGGSALLLGGWVDRTTVDVDVVAVAQGAAPVRARPLPSVLAAAVEDVAAARDLPATWMNPGPADLMDWGLPGGFFNRAIREEYGGLVVFLADRLDLISTKLYAVADQGPTGRHVDDLRALEPTRDELLLAAAWCRSQDPSSAFESMLAAALAMFGVGDVDVRE